MSSYQGKNTELEQQAPTTKKQKIESMELTDVEMENVSGEVGGSRSYAASHFLLSLDGQPAVIVKSDPLPGLTPKP